MERSILYVGLDVHKNTISAAIADGRHRSQVRLYGKIDNTLGALDKLVRKRLSNKSELSVVYEAGPCGYEIHRHLTSKGISCSVAAPSLIPKRSGDRIKTDKRDAVNLARLHRAGELTCIYIPSREDEAMRDLTRCRDDIKRVQRRVRQRLLAFLLRHGFRYNGKKNWTKVHRNWLAGVKVDHPAQQIVLQEYIDAENECSQRLERITGQIQTLLPEWSRFPFVRAYQALRGVSLIVSTTVVSEIGDMKRFKNPKELMGYLGLVPSEHSSGDKVRRGSITRTGNGHVRRVLIQAAWTYRMRARKSLPILKRQEGLPKSVCDISWKAQLRLCKRYRHLYAKGKSKQATITAIARELSAFIWAIDKEVQQSIA